MADWFTQLDALLLSKSMDAAADYAARGRALYALSDAAIISEWLSATDLWSENILNASVRRREADLCSEAKLRDLHLPYENVAGQHEIIFQEIRKVASSMSSTDRLELYELLQRTISSTIKH